MKVKFKENEGGLLEGVHVDVGLAKKGEDNFTYVISVVFENEDDHLEVELDLMFNLRATPEVLEAQISIGEAMDEDRLYLALDEKIDQHAKLEINIIFLEEEASDDREINLDFECGTHTNSATVTAGELRRFVRFPVESETVS